MAVQQFYKGELPACVLTKVETAMKAIAEEQTRAVIKDAHETRDELYKRLENNEKKLDKMILLQTGQAVTVDGLTSHQVEEANRLSTVIVQGQNRAIRAARAKDNVDGPTVKTTLVLLRQDNANRNRAEEIANLPATKKAAKAKPKAAAKAEAKPSAKPLADAEASGAVEASNPADAAAGADVYEAADVSNPADAAPAAVGADAKPTEGFECTVCAQTYNTSKGLKMHQARSSCKDTLEKQETKQGVDDWNDLDQNIRDGKTDGKSPSSSEAKTEAKQTPKAKADTKAEAKEKKPAAAKPKVVARPLTAFFSGPLPPLPPLPPADL